MSSEMQDDIAKKVLDKHALADECAYDKRQHEHQRLTVNPPMRQEHGRMSKENDG